MDSVGRSVMQKALDEAGRGDPLNFTFPELKKAYVLHTLRRTDGHVVRAAKASGLAPKTFYNWIRRYGLEKDLAKIRGAQTGDADAAVWGSDRGPEKVQDFEAMSQIS